MLTQLIRYGLVGTLGTIINLIAFIFSDKILIQNHNICAIAAFLIAVTHNFTLNRSWTFHVKNQQPVGYIKGWIKYVTSNLVGLGINLIVLNAAIVWIGPSHKPLSQLLGILCGMLINFILSKLLVFSVNRNKPQ